MPIVVDLSYAQQHGPAVSMKRSNRVLNYFVRSLTGTGLAATALSAPQGQAAESPASDPGESQKPSWPTFPSPAAGAPNVIVIMLDDVGFGAASAFGGPAQTPALERLAAAGLRYNQFHTTALSSPTRAALLSGRNHHQVGFGTVADTATAHPGYNSIWPKSAASIMEVLRRNGYRTAGFGKWHNTPVWENGPGGPFDRWPNGLGFEYFYGFQGGAATQWVPLLFRNNAFVETPKTPAEGYHFTTDIADDAIGWIHTHQATGADKPYFLYFAPGATHEPLHVPRKWIDKYRGKFDQGWDKLREEIFARQKAAGIIPKNAVLTPRPKQLPAWNSLSADERRLLARQAEVFAGFLEHTDHEIGRLLDAARAGPRGDNTLVFYLVGDNGASAEGGLLGSDINIANAFQGVPNPLEEQLAHIDEIGNENWDNHYSVAWGWATNSPFQWTKGVASHFGGTRNGLVVSWPNHTADNGAVRTQFTHVTDIVPTILEVSGIELPQTVDGVEQLPLAGNSFAATFKDSRVPSAHRSQYFEILGNRAMYQDGWIASARHGILWEFGKWSADFDSDTWELYHVAEDFSQAKNLAKKYPEKLAELQRAFDEEARRNNVLPLQIPTAFQPGVRPNVIANLKQFTYHADQAPISVRNGVPPLTRAHRFEADLTVPASGADGVIVSAGGRLGGFSLFVKEGRLTYASNFYAKSIEEVVATEPLPAGDVTIAVTFTPRSKERWSGGDVKLEINGKVVTEGAFTRTGGWQTTETFDIGRDRGTAVSAQYASPFIYSGVLKQVRLSLL